MLGSPTIFKQTVESTRSGFDTTIALIQGEAAMMQKNRMAAVERATELAQYAAKAQMDIQKDVATAQAKAQVEATAPLSNAQVFQAQQTRNKQINDIIAPNAERFNRLGITRIDTEFDPQSQTFVDYYVKEKDGRFVKEYVDVGYLTTMANSFSKANQALEEINTVISAGLPPTTFTADDRTYFGVSDLNDIMEGLRSNDPDEVLKAYESYRANAGNIPAVDVVRRNQGSEPSEAERKGRNDFITAASNLNRLWKQPDLVRGLGPLHATLHSKPLGEILNELDVRTTQLGFKYGGDLSKISDKDMPEAMAYAAMLKFKQTLNDAISNYQNVQGSRMLDLNKLYWKQDWTPAGGYENVFLYKDQVETSSPASRRSENTSLDVANGYTQQTYFR